MADTSLVFNILARGGKETAAEFLAVAAAEDKAGNEASRMAGSNDRAALSSDRASNSANRTTKQVGLLRLALLAVAPAAVPVMAAAAVGVGAFGAAAVGAGVGLAGFAAIAKTQFTAVQKATQQITSAQQAYNLATTDKARAAAMAKQKAALEALTPVQRMLYQQSVSLKAAWAGVQKQLGAPVGFAVVSWMNAVKAGMGLLAPVVRPVAAALNTLGGEAAKALGSPYWHNFFSLIGGVGGQAVFTLGTVIGNLAKGFAGLLKSFIPLTSSMLPGITALSQKFAEWGNSANAAQGVQKLIAYVTARGPQLVAILKAAVPALVNMTKALAGFGGSSLSGIKVILDVIGKLSPGQLQALAVGFIAIKAGIAGVSAASNAMDLVSKIQKLGLMEKLASAATSAWTAVQWLLNAAMDANPIGLIILAIAGLVAAVLVVVKYHKQLASIAIAAWHGIEAAAKAVWKALVSFFSAAWHAIADPITNAWHLISSVTTTVFSGISNFFKKWWPLLLVIFAAPVAVIMAAWNHFHKTIESVAKTTWNAISSFLGVIWRGIKTAASDVWTGIKIAIINPIKTVMGWLSSAWHSISSVASRGWNLIYNAMVRPIVSAVSYINSQVKKVAGYVWSALVSAYNKVKGIGSWFLNIGKSIVTGIINGIKNGAGWLYNELKNLASSALNAAKSFLGINSPSKVFAKVVGVAIPEGIAKGISDNTHLATGAVNSMASALVPNASSSGMVPLGASASGSAGSRNAVTVKFDMSGADSDMKKMVRKWVRLDGGGNVQIALGGTK